MKVAAVAFGAVNQIVGLDISADTFPAADLVRGKPINIELTLGGWPGKCLRLEREECVPCPGKNPVLANCLAFEVSSKRRRSFPSETRVKRGARVVHGDVELIEKLGRNDLCPCGSGRRFQTLLFEV